ncbi:F0F1 ATP synthase subunit epsilon [Thiotrichales bacterium 19S11-10]|nr:F0F1 ATP synthase subunit epsilon [Thiotrichales bacterium 19S11-10]MCF6807546.1 F0F1 ATP synthase subunit epsilon [Thiotrichales bacterium 19S9-11]MCF6811515.1 F0F1 ATP synthase subunit epsilon [Thiotrichales bacterium 19S9-12]
MSEQSVKSIKVSVVSPEGEVYSDNAISVIARGAEGELGIQYGHTQLLTSLPPGALRIQLENNDEKVLYVEGGMLEVQPTQVIILADTVERPMDVNEQAAKEAKDKAQTLLAKSKNDKISFERAQRELAEAEARLRVLDLMRKVKSR